jgi:hypothetical protein
MSEGAPRGAILLAVTAVSCFSGLILSLMTVLYVSQVEHAFLKYLTGVYVSGGKDGQFSDENTRASSTRWLKSVDHKVKKPHRIAPLLDKAAPYRKVLKKEQLGDIMHGLREDCIDPSSPPQDVVDSESEGEHASGPVTDNDVFA